MDDDVPISDTLRNPSAELTYLFTRTSGPGGQHVNRSATQVELLFDVAGSPSLSDEQRAHIQQKLGNRIDQEGILHLTSSGTRSQVRNREQVTARFQTLLQHALQPPKPRRPTRPSQAQREQRRQAKERRSESKRRRAPVQPDDS